MITRFFARKTFSIFLAVVVGLLVHATAYAVDPNAVLGDWVVESGKAKINIFKCGDKYCGKIVWLREPLDESGKPKLDKKNPDEKLRSRPLMGLVLLTDFVFDDDEWVSGRIYAADEGSDYKCKMWMDGNNLIVKGYIGISLLGKKQTWKRP